MWHTQRFVNRKSGICEVWNLRSGSGGVRMRNAVYRKVLIGKYIFGMLLPRLEMKLTDPITKASKNNSAIAKHF
ncbi:hypothetical protein L596_021943 [Steinernema carpocapsae]|uniref:Uncharacterized protein n=1 Tax=Steinernema carpocapsae TaxID=34508 RepID=A0A4U5ML36_STECR|nr:hypothetical protein L596_021943 [Steinernema carpocapsae]